MKQQHILLLGDHRRPAVELPVRAGDDYQLTYCASDNRDVDVIERVQQRFDWVLIDGASMGGDQMEFFRSLRAIGLLLSEGADSHCNNLSCKVEWDSSGTLQLHCGRRRAAGGAPKRGSGNNGEELSGFVFEYHAPMERTG
ncbi:MAG: hypothetical protein WAL92_05940 [Thiogranum sp.]